MFPAVPSVPAIPAVPAAPASTPMKGDGTDEGPFRAHLKKIEASHKKLAALWSDMSENIITAWKELAIDDLRTAKLKPVFDQLKPRKSYPEVRTLASCRRGRADSQRTQFRLVARSSSSRA